MSTWDDVRKKIQDLEKNPLMDADMLRTMDTISIADYWRRRFEEEHGLTERRMTAKEEEIGQLQERSARQAQDIQLLKVQVDAAKTQLSDRENYWQEKTRALELELRGARERMDWEVKTRILEEHNKLLLEHSKRVPKRDDEDESVSRRKREELEAAKSRADREVHELRARLNVLQDEKIKWEQERPKLTALAEEAHRLKSSKAELETKLIGLEAELEKLRGEASFSREKLGPMSDSLQRMAQNMERREKEHLTLMEDLGRGFAHRVRNFLGIMSGTLQLCLANHKMADDLQQQIHLVDENCQEMLKTIEEFLSLVRVPEMRFEVAQLNDVVARGLAASDEKLKAANVNLYVKKTESKIWVRNEPRLLGEALDALAMNAIEAMPDGGKLSVEIEDKTADGMVDVIFQDSGKGISESHIRKIFQPYFTTKKGHKGLGLTIVQRVMELHRGVLSVTSNRGEGARIVLSFPIAAPGEELH